MRLASIDARRPALGSRARCVGDRSAWTGNQILQPFRPGSAGRSCVFPWASRHPASHLHRQPALCRLPDHAGREHLRWAGQAIARPLLRCSGYPRRRGHELERPAQAHPRRSAREGEHVVPTAARGHPRFRCLMLSECLSQFRRDAARAHRRSRRQQPVGARMGHRPGRRPAQLRNGFTAAGRTAECAGLAQGRPRLPDCRSLFLSPGLCPRGTLFAEIGRDASSPWQKAGRYLVARCAVHAAIADKTPKLIADAQQAIDAVATDPDLGEYRADAPKLASLLAFATRPQERAQELERALLAPDLPPTLAVELRDFLLLERTGTRYTDLGAWIL